MPEKLYRFGHGQGAAISLQLLRVLGVVAVAPLALLLQRHVRRCCETLGEARLEALAQTVAAGHGF